MQSDEQIIAEARSWVGTKWKHGVALKGFGTDCVQFIVAIAKQFEWIPNDLKTPKYNRDWALHNSESLLIPELEKHCHRVNFHEVQVGDVLIFKYGQCASHAGIYIGDGRMVHSHVRHGVQED